METASVEFKKLKAERKRVDEEIWDLRGKVLGELRAAEANLNTEIARQCQTTLVPTSALDDLRKMRALYVVFIKAGAALSEVDDGARVTTRETLANIHEHIANLVAMVDL